jgi:hypothetical protein
MNRNSRRESRTLTAALAAASTLLLGGHAMASPIVVLNDGDDRDTIISRAGYYIHLFAHEITLEPVVPTEFPSANTLSISFGYSFGQVRGSISGNALRDWPPLPIQSPSLLVPGRLMIDGWVLDESLEFMQPDYDLSSGGTNVAQLAHGTSPTSAFDLNDFTNVGDMAYIGYATSDLSMFGYMQIERVTEVDWKLVGYAFDPSGEGILVQNLVVPTPAALALLGAPLVMRPKGRVAACR